MAVIVLKEKLTAWRKIGIVLIIAGAVMIRGPRLGDFGGRESIGQAIFLSATLLWAAYTPWPCARLGSTVCTPRRSPA